MKLSSHHPLTNLHIGAPVEDLEKLLQQPHAALAAAADGLHRGVILHPLLQPAQNEADQLDHGDDEGSQRHGAQVVDQRVLDRLQNRTLQLGFVPA